MTFAEKYLRTPGVIETAGRWVKRYHVGGTGGLIPEGIQEAAYSFLPHLLPKPDDQTPPAGWAVLYESTGIPAFLVAYSWTWTWVPRFP